MSFPDRDIISKIESGKIEPPDFYDEEEPERHPYCPAHGWDSKTLPWRPGLCECKRLFKADREAAKEEAAEARRKGE